MTRLEVINEQIDEIMDTFDFDKVRRVMETLEWEWASTKGIPDEYEIRKNARKLMKSLIDLKDGGCASTGGFKATLTQRADDGSKWLRVDLAFCVDDSLLDGEDYE